MPGRPPADRRRARSCRARPRRGDAAEEQCVGRHLEDAEQVGRLAELRRIGRAGKVGLEPLPGKCERLDEREVIAAERLREIPGALAPARVGAEVANVVLVVARNFAERPALERDLGAGDGAVVIGETRLGAAGARARAGRRGARVRGRSTRHSSSARWVRLRRCPRRIRRRGSRCRRDIHLPGRRPRSR